MCGYVHGQQMCMRMDISFLPIFPHFAEFLHLMLKKFGGVGDNC